MTRKKCWPFDVRGYYVWNNVNDPGETPGDL